MPSSHDLNGLMKFLMRDPWQECFDAVFDEHVGIILDASDMEFDDVVEIIGEDWAMTLWGAVFEDFLTQDFDVDGVNIIDEYLKRRGWKEGAQAKAYMKALRTSVMSLYEVSDVVPGTSLLARDLIRGGEPVLVHEGTATKTLQQWDRIAARIVPVMGRMVFAGGLLPFKQQNAETLIGDIHDVLGGKTSKKRAPVRDEDLQALAPMFSMTWLSDGLEQVMDVPDLQNGDGEPLLFHEARFPLATGTTQKDIAARLGAVPGLSQENAKFWNWLEEKPKGKGKGKGKGKSAADMTLDTIMDNGLRVLGNLELKGRFLHVSTNSATRAEKAVTLVEQSLGDLVRSPLTEIRTVEQMMADPPVREEDDPMEGIPPEIAEQIVHEFMDRQYRETLDQPVGMLGDKTPRQAVRSSAGRQKVADWLKYLENQSGQRPDAADPMSSYDFGWMWRELGVLDLRK
jgi:hypothetical protein